MRWPETFLVLLLLSIQAYRWAFGNAPLTGGIGVHAAQWTSQRKLDTRYVVSGNETLRVTEWSNRNQVRDLWYHGYDNYMKHGSCSLTLSVYTRSKLYLAAFPMDEVPTALVSMIA